MADFHVTKRAAAQRQIDAAVRVLFAEVDPLAVHTVVAAALGILVDLDKKRRKRSVLHDAYSDVLKKLDEQFPNTTSMTDVLALKNFLQNKRRKPANFLKHADRDPANTLNPATLETDHLLLEACALYVGLGLVPTCEMNAFVQWHLAVYPHEAEDQVNTAAGFVHSLDRSAKLQFGAFLLDRLLEHPQA